MIIIRVDRQKIEAVNKPNDNQILIETLLIAIVCENDNGLII